MAAGKTNWVDALPIVLLKMRNQERQGLFLTRTKSALEDQ